jgi:hypothetical protein
MSAQSAAPLFTPAVTATTDAPPLPARQPESTSPPADSPPAESEENPDDKLPKWIICIPTDHEHGTDPNADPPEIIRLCRKCGTSCWV